jgi:hypothetical protein
MDDETLLSRIDAEIRAADLDALVRTGNASGRLYKQTDPNRYGRLALRISDAMGGFNFNTDYQYAAASDLAFDALDVRDKIEGLDILIGLAERMRVPADGSGSAASVAAFREIRLREAQKWLSVYQRVLSDSQIKVDPNFVPLANWVPPGFTNIVVKSGMDPQGIADPVQRKAYADAIAEHDMQMRSYNERALGERLLPRCRKSMVDFLVYAYIKAPNDRAQLDKLMEGYEVEVDVRNAVLKRLPAGPEKK